MCGTYEMIYSLALVRRARFADEKTMKIMNENFLFALDEYFFELVVIKLNKILQMNNFHRCEW